MTDENPLFQNTHPQKKVLQPVPGQAARDAHDAAPNPAADLIRQKLGNIFGDEPNAKEEIKEAEAAGVHRSKHQKFMYDLSTSGKALAEIQDAWHKYYLGLPDKEKHEVWQEFYAEHSRVDQKIKAARVHPPQQSAPVTSAAEEPAKKRRSTAKELTHLTDNRSASDIKNQLVKKVNNRSAARKSHLQSLVFGLGMGVIVVAVMLFGFFNERIIAPFIKPSRTVSSTAIITDLTTTASGTDPKIIIPKINVEIPVVYDNTSIVEKDMQKALERGVVHYATTANPGEKGNAVLFGHSSNNILNKGKYKFAFVLLSRMQKDDTFMLEKNGQRYVYKVFSKKIVPPTDLSVLESISSKTATATLITCDPPGTSINRLVVVGEQISPSPNQNIASTAKPAAEVPDDSAVLPSNSPSLWSRITGWF